MIFETYFESCEKKYYFDDGGIKIFWYFCAIYHVQTYINLLII